jgi:hypothetical protein
LFIVIAKSDLSAVAQRAKAEATTQSIVTVIPDGANAILTRPSSPGL